MVKYRQKLLYMNSNLLHKLVHEKVKLTMHNNIIMYLFIFLTVILYSGVLLSRENTFITDKFGAIDLSLLYSSSNCVDFAVWFSSLQVPYRYPLSLLLLQ